MSGRSIRLAFSLKRFRMCGSASEAILTNNLNNRIKTLTVLTILLTVPTIVSSLFGMNVPLPLEDNQYAFEFVIAVVPSRCTGGVVF